MSEAASASTAAAAATATTDRFELRPLRGDELELLFDHCGECFAPKTERSYFVTHFYTDPTRDVQNILVAFDKLENKIASCVKIFIRDVHVQGRLVRTGGLGDVCTKERYRKHGLASRLLQLAVSRMHEQALEMSILRAKPELGAFYGKAGFVPIPMIGADVFVRRSALAGAPRISATLKLLSAVEFPPFIPQLSTIYNHWSPQFNGTFARSEEYWRTWTVPATVPDNRLFVALDQTTQKVLAYSYFQYRPQYGTYEVRELLWEPSEHNPEKFVNFFMQAFLDVLRKDEIVCWVPNPAVRLLPLKADSVLPLKELREDRTNHYLFLQNAAGQIPASLVTPPPRATRYTINSLELSWHAFFRVDAY